MSLALIIALISFIGWVYLAFFHDAFWQPLTFPLSPEPTTWPEVAIIVPARNETDSLPQTLPSWLAQDYKGVWRVILVDDHSTDGTAATARAIAKRLGREDRLEVIAAPDLPQGWLGKVAAMQAGVAASQSDYILFTDADIRHAPHSLSRLVARAVEMKLDLTSQMVRLRCVAVAEKLLIPAFVFFFGMLYPFRRANDANHDMAAAAGGTMLVRRKALQNAGGMAALRNALIDDCTLARAIKLAGGGADEQGLPVKGRIELTLATDTESLRPYPDIADVWDMVARTAFTQLRYSTAMLAGALCGLSLLFLVPPLLPVLSDSAGAGLWAMAAWLLMALIYVPMVMFYKQSPLWALTLPLAAAIYMAATFDSALRYWRGQGGLWKGRAQAS
ncbi:MAG: glycosyltransferase [Alphaproteobacteria bacterium]|nr:glycosyltransferase [Alphaproteobacteria bacterium]MBV8549354.1 glycosyltransferase [Alphaproteobacteria bacterium]